MLELGFDKNYVQLCAEMAYNEVIMESYFENFILEQEENKFIRLKAAFNAIITFFKNIINKIKTFFSNIINKIRNKRNTKEEDKKDDIKQSTEEKYKYRHDCYVYRKIEIIENSILEFFESKLYPFADELLDKNKFINLNKNKDEYEKYYKEFISKKYNEIDEFEIKWDFSESASQDKNTHSVNYKMANKEIKKCIKLAIDNNDKDAVYDINTGILEKSEKDLADASKKISIKYEAYISIIHKITDELDPIIKSANEKIKNPSIRDFTITEMEYSRYFYNIIRPLISLLSTATTTFLNTSYSRCNYALMISNNSFYKFN